MNVWFARANGPSGHNPNDPGNLPYAPGAPRAFPVVPFNYRLNCLRDGFLRIGRPAAGDLRLPGWRDANRRAYGMTRTEGERDLQAFASILTGDCALLPADAGQYYVHLGVVVRRDRKSREILPTAIGVGAYYHYFDPPAGDYFENAHRVDVQWATQPDGQPSVFHIPELGGVWRRWFSRVVSGRDTVLELAHGAGLVTAVAADRPPTGAGVRGSVSVDPSQPDRRPASSVPVLRRRQSQEPPVAAPATAVATLSVDDLADLRRRLMALLDRVDTARQNAEGIRKRISRLSHDGGPVPRHIAAMMATITEMRNSAEYEAKVLTATESAAVRMAWQVIQEWAQALRP